MLFKDEWMTFSPQAYWRGGGDGGKGEWLGLGEKASKRRGNNCEVTFVCITLSEVDFLVRLRMSMPVVSFKLNTG